MIRTQVSLEEKTYREARSEAKRQGVSFAEFCRRALDAALRHRGGEKAWMRFSGAIDAPIPDASQSVDEVLYTRDRP